ncbi:MAG: four-helix bundle copper-binding protein [Bdellovibrio bacteriovorus]
MNEKNSPSDLTDEVSRPRRDLLIGAAALGTISGLSVLGLARAEEHSHEHHQHTIDEGRQRVIQHASDCVVKGEICIEHCLRLFKAGDTSVAECAATTQEMLASCTAMRKLAVLDSAHLKDLMRVCIGVCEDCEKACREHENKHAECKACADSCADCIRVCKEYLA